MAAFIEAVLLVGRRFLAMVGILVRHPRQFVRWVALTDPREHFFKFTHPKLTRYMHYLLSVYAKCQHPARPIDLQKAFNHTQECPKCREEFNLLIERETFFSQDRIQFLAARGVLDELFEASHPELLGVIPTMRSVYASCGSVKADDPYLARLEVVWQHVSACARCSEEIQAVQRRNRKIANEPVYTGS